MKPVSASSSMLIRFSCLGGGGGGGGGAVLELDIVADTNLGGLSFGLISYWVY